MPVKIIKSGKKDGYKVTHGGKVAAKNTSKSKAEAQKRLIDAVRHGWKPTGKPGRKR